MPNKSGSKHAMLMLEDAEPAVLQRICGADDAHLRRIEAVYDVRIFGLPGHWEIEGERAEAGMYALRKLASMAQKGDIGSMDVESLLRESDRQEANEAGDPEHIAGKGSGVLVAGRRQVQGKTANQRHYLHAISENVLTLAVGPAGCGKTYLAVAAAVVALQSHQVERIILTRPAVEAGERLGFLPGDLQQKVDPYLRPLFDALTDMLGLEKMTALMEAGRIEIAPLAYMRGRTLNDAFVILDEAQNTTREQMKMFLTRLGFSSKMVVTGDITQIDLPQHQPSGLSHALKVLHEVSDIAICRLTGKDVVRHRLVESIVSAYERSEKVGKPSKK